MSTLQCDLVRNLRKRSSYMYKERAGKEKHGKERGTNGQERKRSRKARKGVCRNRNGQAREGAGMRLFLFHIGTTAQGRTDIIVRHCDCQIPPCSIYSYLHI